MKNILWKLALIAGCVCAGGLTTTAAPLSRGDVPANPGWVLHLDCDALRPTVVGQHIQTEMDQPESKVKLALFRAFFSFDLRTQLHGVTLYGVTAAPEDAVLILYADFDAKWLENLAKAANDYQSSPYKNAVIHNWIDDKRKTESNPRPRTYAALHQNRIVFGQREDRVKTALDVIQGAEANLASNNPFSELGAYDGTRFLEAAVRKLKLPDTHPNAALVKLSQSIQVTLGESQGRFFGTMTLVADSEEVAGHAFSILQGLVALGRLADDKPETVKLLNALSLQLEGNRVVGTFTMPASEAVEVMKADAARKAAAKASRVGDM
jgi:hypothetical protein